MLDIIIRKATHYDIDALVHLLQILFSIEKDFHFNAEQQRNGLHLLMQSDNTQLLVAENNSTVIGMVSGQRLISTAEGAFSLVVEDLVIDDQFRNKGIGKMLLEAIGIWGKTNDAKRMQLLADTTNTNALFFYNHLQWQRTKLVCLRKYYPEER